MHLVWDAGAMDASGEPLETLVCRAKSMEFMEECVGMIGNEDGGNLSSDKQLKKRKILPMVGPKTPEALVQRVLANLRSER